LQLQVQTSGKTDFDDLSLDLLAEALQSRAGEPGQDGRRPSTPATERLVMIMHSLWTHLKRFKERRAGNYDHVYTEWWPSVKEKLAPIIVKDVGSGK
jgi:hypothetical protein